MHTIIMKALILAAGFGSRLAPLTDNCPKSLVKVNGKPILFKQIDNLHENGITDITVISGYLADIMEHDVKEAYPDVKVIESKDYATTNNMYSAYLGSKSVEGEEFLLMNADVFYDASVVKALLACPHKNAVVVDMGRYIEESMKVIEKDGRLTEIAKTITEEECLGSSIDVYKFSKEGGEEFFKVCRDYIENKGELKKWTEVALNDAFKLVEFKACPLDGRWLEIDNHEDLHAAEELFA